MLLGHARGKVGDLVFSRVNGQQVTRARAAVVKNPQTEAQMIQRILLNTVIQAYSRMSGICDHSFEGVPTGQQSMSVFMRRNLSYLRQMVSDAVNLYGYTFDDVYAFAPIGTNEFTMNPWILSTGTLPSIQIADISALNGARVAVNASGANLTYEDVITSFVLQRGDQLTFVSQEAWTDRRAAFNFARVILDPRDANGNQLDLSTEFLSGTSINMPNPRNEGEGMLYSFSQGYLTFNRSDNAQFGAAVIVSRQQSDGSWLRSNTSLTLVAGVNLLINARSLQECLDLFEAGSIDVENPLYLNNARRVTGASTGADTSFANSFGYFAPNAAFADGVTTGTVNLVAARLTTIGAAPAVLVTDTNGIDYALLSMNAAASTYKKYLKALDGSQATAWTAFSGTTNDLSIPCINVYPINDDDTWNDFTAWLYTQGVQPGVFTNP